MIVAGNSKGGGARIRKEEDGNKKEGKWLPHD